MRVGSKITLVAFSVVGWKAFIDLKICYFCRLAQREIIMSESFNDFLHLFQTSNFCSIFLILADYGRTNILIKRLSIDQLSKRFTGNLILFCFVLFFFTSHCDWLRKHESSMAFLLQEPRKKANYVCSTINSRELSYVFFVLSRSSADFYDSTAGIVQKLRNL